MLLRNQLGLITCDSDRQFKVRLDPCFSSLSRWAWAILWVWEIFHSPIKLLGSIDHFVTTDHARHNRVLQELMIMCYWRTSSARLTVSFGGFSPGYQSAERYPLAKLEARLGLCFYVFTSVTHLEDKNINETFCEQYVLLCQALYFRALKTVSRLAYQLRVRLFACSSSGFVRRFAYGRRVRFLTSSSWGFFKVAHASTYDLQRL